jgi:hypothetical protein
MTHGSLILPWSSGFSGTFETLLVTIFSSTAPQSLISSLILMLTRPAAPTLAVLHQVTVSSLATTWYLGFQSSSTLSPALVPKPNTAVLPMPSPKLLVYASYMKNFTHLLTELLLFTVTTSLPFISRPTRCNISAPSTSRLICTLFATRLLPELFVFVMYLPLPNTQMSSPRGFHHRSL